MITVITTSARHFAMAHFVGIATAAVLVEVIAGGRCIAPVAAALSDINNDHRWRAGAGADIAAHCGTRCHVALVITTTGVAPVVVAYAAATAV